ncbi:hypothetical protein DFH27DRAFT_463508, partial [Peziza echinospora]
RKEMSDAEKGAIVAFFYLNYSIAMISFFVGRPWSTIKNFITRIKERGNIENLSRPGRPVK